MYVNNYCTGRKFQFFSLLPALEKEKNTHKHLSSLTFHLSIIPPPPPHTATTTQHPLHHTYLPTCIITCDELTCILALLRHPREPDLNPPLPVSHQLKRDQGSPKEVLRVMIARGACLIL